MLFRARGILQEKHARRAGVAFAGEGIGVPPTEARHGVQECLSIRAREYLFLLGE